MAFMLITYIKNMVMKVNARIHAKNTQKNRILA